MNHDQIDTIVSLSTATPAAIGVIRLSGGKAKSALSSLFQPIGGGKLEEYSERKLIYGTLLDQDGTPIDKVLATYSNAPNTYTGEDTAELHCHGSPMVIAIGLEALFAQGCRQSLRGEFTQRSFLNGKLDLAQAEGVVDLIEATSPLAVHQAVSQLGGALSKKIENTYQSLTTLLAHFCAVLDYPDEDIDPFGEETIRKTITQEQTNLENLKQTWQRGRQVASGIATAIVGLPNAGKSSLFNHLLGYERAIVTDRAGTTRDTLEGEITLGEHRLRLVDTAGIRESSDEIERLGVERSHEVLQSAELVLVVIDGSTPLVEEERKLIQECQSEHTIILLNKVDIGNEIEDNELKADKIIQISAKIGTGVNQLQNEINNLFNTNSINHTDGILTNLRQVEGVSRALACLEGALVALESGLTADAILTDVEGALEALGQLTGRSVSADVTGELFARFCVGK
ncbi:MAG: tRNA uridine-5-carboxymethylaminomethyl(34) synthesis GTPase MnmE [Eubacteriales bacterium]